MKNVKSKPRATQTRTTPDKDERFLSSFKEYAALLVDESCRELKPGREKYSTPGAEFYRAGRRLVKDSIGLEIAHGVKELVEEVDDLAARGKLTPDAGRVIPTPSGMSIYGVWATFNGLAKYFEKMGLALYSGVDVFQNKHISGHLSRRGGKHQVARGA